MKQDPVNLGNISSNMTIHQILKLKAKQFSHQLANFTVFIFYGNIVE
jgi:hypothetical protein